MNSKTTISTGTDSLSTLVPAPPAETTRPGPSAPLRLQMAFAHPGTATYQICVDRVKRKYLDHYGAVVDPRPDLFVIVWDGGGPSPTSDGTLGVAGLTSAAGRRLLSENYLNIPVEHACTGLTSGPPVQRGAIAEMGPLASFYPGTGMYLMRALPRIARHLGYEFLLSTLTQKLHTLARAAGWDFHTLTNARRADLAATHSADWGTYYSTKPRTGILHCGQTIALQATG
ncbi:thermostable hemolysin [Sphaerisporangium sp. NPDC051011]|uniref:thermostable hemolysin n=1 Tax=Sphaerisporangium sp. NPDC051011 TaxID=3155792 RepID=UPI0033CC98F4